MKRKGPDMGCLHTSLRDGYWVSLQHDANGRKLTKAEQSDLWEYLTEFRTLATIRQVTGKRRSDLAPNEVLATHPNAWPKDIRRHYRPDKVVSIKKLGWICFPPRFGVQHFGPALRTDVRQGIDVPNFQPSDDFALIDSLKQGEAVAAVKETVSRCGGCVLQVPTGCGKTVVSLFLASQWGKKTIVLVHKKDILDSWVKTANVWFPTARVGVIQGKRMEVDADIVIAMIQTLQKRELSPEQVAGFGTLVVDEAQHYGSSWGEVFPALYCARMIALSATPEDALGPVLDWWFGPVAFTFKRPKGHTVVRKVVYHREGRVDIKQRGSDVIDFTEMSKAVAYDEERNDLLVKAIGIDAKENLDPAKDEAILVLTIFRDHATLLVEKLGDIAGLWLGGMKDEERDAAISKRIIVSTYSCAGEGTDIKKLRRLWMVLSRGKAKQNVGRIVRGACAHVGVVCDVVDDFSVFERQWYRRKREYAEENVVVQDHTTLDRCCA